eukprot:CAMPEP_0179155680 /NCGR_PEP_ID=MMETSP0796-20121207/75847_1 /TAXON_ID=73915 /ORGANISM="Pyrodinium bahamense, Strain pbaha01" /LENGTH=44 /DNA_ID= /DNA_START= /DNA_END= /DNA_ORIENTATION=
MVAGRTTAQMSPCRSAHMVPSLHLIGSAARRGTATATGVPGPRV